MLINTRQGIQLGFVSFQKYFYHFNILLATCLIRALRWKYNKIKTPRVKRDTEAQQGIT